MSKRSKKKKLHLSEAEVLLEKLHKLIREGRDENGVAQSMITWWMENQYWTVKQWAYIRAIVARKKRKRQGKRKYWLYAIKSGSAVKLGFSTDVKRRRRDMQTGQQQQLSIKWKYYVDTNKGEAMKLEKKLHRFCKKYKMRGEWFRAECMTIVEQFSIREKTSRDYANEEAELEILAEAEKRI